MGEQAGGVLRELTAQAVAEAKAIIVAADHAALATIEPGSGHPLASRVGLATLPDGTPVILNLGAGGP